MRKLIALSSVAVIGAAPPPQSQSAPDAKLRAIIAPVSASQLRATVETLVSFGDIEEDLNVLIIE